MCAGKNYGLLFLRVLLFELARSTDITPATAAAEAAAATVDDGAVKKPATKPTIIDKPMTKPHRSVRVSIAALGKGTTE